MTGPHVIPFPAYIPPDVDIVAVNAAVSRDGVSAPAADVPGLKAVVADAEANGIDLKIVVIPTNPPIDTPLRDIATEVGQAHPGSTVLTISPSFAGTYSEEFDRATLEAGQDVAKTGNPVQSATNFVGELEATHFPWTAFTVVLVIGVLAAAVATRLLQVRARRAPAGSDVVENAAPPAN